MHSFRFGLVALVACFMLPAQTVRAAMTTAGILQHSPDDITGFTTLTGDNVVNNVNLGFTFVVEGVSYTTIALSTNGWIEFGANTAGDSDPTNDCLPTGAHTNPFLAPYWDDTAPFGTNIRYGTVGSAPNRVFIADYELDLVSGSEGSDDMRMQVQLHEGSNLITVRYRQTQSNANGQAATLGFQGAGGASATTVQPISCNVKTLDDNRPNEGWSADVGRAGFVTMAGVLAYSPDDIGGFTTLSGDNAVNNVALPFNVTIEGTSYTSLAISTNGWIEFGGNTAGDSDPTNDCLPSSAHTNPLLAAYWDDVNAWGGAIRYGIVGTAPNRMFVADYQLDVTSGEGADDLFMQVRIHERSSLITVRYRDTQANANGQAATIGFQGAGGGASTAYPLVCNGKILDDNDPAHEGFSVHPKTNGAVSLHAINAYSIDDVGGIAGLGTFSGDDVVQNVSLPFNVVLDGVTYNNLSISTNGWIEIGGNTAGDSDPTNDCLPTSAHTRPFIAAFWDDMRTAGSSSVEYGTVGTAPNRTFLVDYFLDTKTSADDGADDVLVQVQIHETSNVISVKYPPNQHLASGQTATIGYQAAGGGAAATNPIGCNARMLDDNISDVGWSVAPLQICGNGIVEPREHCDLAGANGAGTSCCTSTCGFRAGGSTCRATAGVCDVAETCTGSSATCPGDGFASSATPCRTAAGLCDVTENCTGSGAACPADVIRPNGFTCRGAADVCDVAETCDGSSTACPADGFVAGGTECRAAAGDCDVAETCTGSGASCPADAVVGAGVECRAAAGICDVAESCDGSGAACPANGFVAGGTECRAAAGDCDVAESCTGSGAACPADVLVAGGTECRASAGICDVAEACDGVTAGCPADAFEPSSTECRAAAGDCDVAESCTGSGAACPADVLVAGGTQCRASAGICDVEEACDGVDVACPADAFEPSSTECRATAGDCDVAESCTGSGAACPADVLVGAGTECRASAGICDVAEACDGVDAACPADAFEPSSTECRAAAGDCDVAESCTGSGAACPGDVLAPATQVCRPGSGDLCDPDETCTGSDVDCPADVVEPATTVCNAGSGDACDPDELCSGTAGEPCPADSVSGAFVVCRPGSGDACDPDELCTGNADEACPSDAITAGGTVCRPGSGDLCDPDEACTGTAGEACPADVVEPASTVCRAAAGGCDVAESCTGAVGVACPADVLVAAGESCRAAAGACDVAETCDGVGAACPADAKSVAECRAAVPGGCDVAESCDGVTDDCPTDVVATAGTSCRAAAGDCDVAETCDGSANTCPTDTFAPSTTECRGAAGVCDVAETCTGSGASCPADAKSTATCRPAAGSCDAAESCDGAGNDCPADALEPATTVCRAATDLCDAAETCTGSSSSCPTDALATAGTVCRATTGACDPAETCDGSVATCPADIVEEDPDGDEVCGEDDNCPDDDNGTQTDGDGDGTGDACDPCTGGANPVKTKMTIAKLSTPPGDDTFKLSGSVTVPTTPAIAPVTKGIRLLVVDATGTEIIDATLPGGAYSSATRTGWTANGAGTAFKYKHTSKTIPAIDGITKATLKLKPSVPSLIKFSIGGKKSNYAVIPANLPLTATLVIDSPIAMTGQCGEEFFANVPSGNPERCALIPSGATLRCK